MTFLTDSQRKSHDIVHLLNFYYLHLHRLSISINNLKYSRKYPKSLSDNLAAYIYIHNRRYSLSSISGRFAFRTLSIPISKRPSPILSGPEWRARKPPYGFNQSAASNRLISLTDHEYVGHLYLLRPRFSRIL